MKEPKTYYAYKANWRTQHYELVSVQAVPAKAGLKLVSGKEHVSYRTFVTLDDWKETPEDALSAHIEQLRENIKSLQAKIAETGRHLQEALEKGNQP